jgi:hypothetical protein
VPRLIENRRARLPRRLRSRLVKKYFEQTVLKRGIRRRWQYQSANEMGLLSEFFEAAIWSVKTCSMR